MPRRKGSEQIAVILPPGLRKQAKVKAAKTGRSIAAIVREALVRFVKGDAS